MKRIRQRPVRSSGSSGSGQMDRMMWVVWLDEGGDGRTKMGMNPDIDPHEDNDRQEPIILDSSHNVGVDDNDPESVNDSWKMHVEALCMSLDEAEWYKHAQPTKRQEILMNFLWMVHFYKLADSYKIC